MANSTISSINDTLDGGISPSGGSLSTSDPSTLQKKLMKIDKCILNEEKNLQTIQDELIKLGMSPDKNPVKHQHKIRDLEQANDKASRQIEEYKKKKIKYESALRGVEQVQRAEASKTRKESRDERKTASLPPGVTISDAIKPGTRVLSLFQRQTRNGDGAGSAKSKESRGSKDDSPAPPADNSTSRLLTSDISVSSLESDSRDSQKKQKRLDEITEVVDSKLDPLASYMHDVKDRMEEMFKLIEDSRSEQSENHKSNTAIFDDIIRRCGYVEEQIHDIIELHQKETAETKTYLADTQDKMNYIFHERIRDMREEINTLNTRIAKIEHRQKEDESLARTEAAKSVMGEMAFKMVDCVLLFGQLVIAVVGAVSQFFQMTAENSTRLVIFLFVIIAFLVLMQFRDELPFSEEMGHFFSRITRPISMWVYRMPGADLVLPAFEENATMTEDKEL